MFTGIVEELGRVASIRHEGPSAVLNIEAPYVLSDAHIGDSIAVNGVCLTVTSIKGSVFSADCMHETLRRSSLGELRAGSSVNLERAMSAQGRFGGHIVSGHIDGCGTIAKIERDANAVWFTVKASDAIMRYVVEKGSICIDGISLTVAALTKDSLSVSVIPHTMEVTNLGTKAVGSTVNLECDIIGKYVEKLMQPASAEEANAGISMDFLIENGF